MPYADLIEPGTDVALSAFDPGRRAGLSKSRGQAKLEQLDARLDVIQEELYAAGMNSVLVVLQGMDTSGKDGAIRTVFRSCDPQGVQVTSFKVPTEEELAHDFLWRVHQAVPRNGMIGIFNRSHYEDVLIVRVHELVPEKVWRRRYEQINEFEQLLVESGTVVLKFFLHISKQEQEERLRAREEDIRKAWKLSAGDWRERELWDQYIQAYEEALTRCSTAHAPWRVVPSNYKWYRSLAIAEAIVETLEGLRPAWQGKLENLAAERRAELDAYRTGEQPD